MKVKRKIGAGVKHRQKRHRRQRNQRSRRRAGMKKSSKKGQGLTFNQILKKTRQVIRNKGKKAKNTDIRVLIKQSLAAVKKYKLKKNSHMKRILPIPKVGGALPLIPILAALSHVGSLVGGVTSIVDAIKKIKSVRDEYKTQQGSGTVQARHIGGGLAIGPHKKGLGLLSTKS